MGVEVHDVDRAQRLQTADERIADGMVAADRDRQRTGLGDAAHDLGHTVEVRVQLRPLNGDVPHVRHGHTDETVAAEFHVVPPSEASTP